MNKRIYLDYNATTPVDPEVLHEMLPFFTEEFGNPSSSHSYGWVAHSAVENARKQVASILNVSHNEICFTSGATEANNLALIGFALKWREQNPNKKAHLITAKAEHSSILETFYQLEKMDFNISILPVNSYGQIELNDIENAIRPETILISFMWANNEVGSLNPIKQISEIAKKHNLIFHTDATQACGKIPIDLSHNYIDLLSFSSHKIYGPKGIGALYISQRIKDRGGLIPIINGGQHEGGMRAGTLNVPGIIGFGKACEISLKNLEQESICIRNLSSYFFQKLKTLFPNIILNGHPNDRLPGQFNIQFVGFRMEQYIHRMARIAVSSGSACSSNNIHQSSHVLEAIGLTQPQILSSIRLSIGRCTTQEELENTLIIFKETIKN